MSHPDKENPRSPTRDTKRKSSAPSTLARRIEPLSLRKSSTLRVRKGALENLPLLRPVMKARLKVPVPTVVTMPVTSPTFAPPTTHVVPTTPPCSPEPVGSRFIDHIFQRRCMEDDLDRKKTEVAKTAARMASASAVEDVRTHSREGDDGSDLRAGSEIHQEQSSQSTVNPIGTGQPNLSNETKRSFLSESQKGAQWACLDLEIKTGVPQPSPKPDAFHSDSGHELACWDDDANRSRIYLKGRITLKPHPTGGSVLRLLPQETRFQIMQIPIKPMPYGKPATRFPGEREFGPLEPPPEPTIEPGEWTWLGRDYMLEFTITIPTRSLKLKARGALRFQVMAGVSFNVGHSGFDYARVGVSAHPLTFYVGVGDGYGLMPPRGRMFEQRYMREALAMGKRTDKGSPAFPPVGRQRMAY